MRNAMSSGNDVFWADNRRAAVGTILENFYANDEGPVPVGALSVDDTRSLLIAVLLRKRKRPLL